MTVHATTKPFCRQRSMRRALEGWCQPWESRASRCIGWYSPVDLQLTVVVCTQPGADCLASILSSSNNVASNRGSGIFGNGGEFILWNSIVAFDSSASQADAHGIEVADGSVWIHNDVIAFQDSNGFITRGSAIADIRNNIIYANGRSSPTVRGRGIASCPHRTASRIGTSSFSRTRWLGCSSAVLGHGRCGRERDGSLGRYRGELRDGPAFCRSDDRGFHTPSWWPSGSRSASCPLRGTQV